MNYWTLVAYKCVYSNVASMGSPFDQIVIVLFIHNIHLYITYIIIMLYMVIVCMLWNILFMAPRIKLIVILNFLWSEFVETNATFRSASETDRNVAFVSTNSLSVEADRNVAFVSTNSLQCNFKITVCVVFIDPWVFR